RWTPTGPGPGTSARRVACRRRSTSSTAPPRSAPRHGQPALVDRGLPPSARPLFAPTLDPTRQRRDADRPPRRPARGLRYRRRRGLGMPRASALVRLCRSLDLEQLRDVPTDAAAARLVRESRIGPWSVGVVCLEGLGRYERGLVGDLGLVKLLALLRGRWVEGWETAELLEPYGDWAGLASVYMLAGFKDGTLPISQRLAACTP